jgi:hypothetical protein
MNRNRSFTVAFEESQAQVVRSVPETPDLVLRTPLAQYFSGVQITKANPAQRRSDNAIGRQRLLEIQ